MNTTKTKQIYFNKAQQYVLHMMVRILVVLASRRFGKSEGIIAPRLLQHIQLMPRGQHGIVAATYKQALTRTLPATFHALERFGYKEGSHFYVGRKAPKSACFAEPYIKPRNYDNYVHWYNGSVNPIISQDVQFSSNSLTLTSIIVDEAKTIKRDKLFDETIPAITPLSYFQDCHLEGSQVYVSDMPTNKEGLWLLDLEKEQDDELISVIETLVWKLWDISRKGLDNSSRKKRYDQVLTELNAYRREAVLFAVFDILDNLEIVGERYVMDMYRRLPPFKFLTAILSKRIKHTQGGFYAALNEKLHYYTAYNNTFLNNFRTKHGDIDWRAAKQSSNDCRQDSDITESKPLYIAVDTNININWIVVGQPNYHTKELKVVKSFFVKHPAMLPEVCQLFAEYYGSRTNRDVIFYHDQTMLQGKSANSDESFVDTIVRVIRNNYYRITPVYIGQAPSHSEKHMEIDQAFKGNKNLFPKFNRPNNEDLCIALEKARTKTNANGWGKDKSEEKLEDSDENPTEHRTDGTDAFDTLFYGCNFHPFESQSSGISLSTSVS